MQTHPGDDVLYALADEQRRLVVRYLMNDEEGVTSYRELADYIASHSAVRPERARLRLEHTTLPLLAEAKLLQYDAERERIQYRSDEFAETVLAVVGGECS